MSRSVSSAPLVPTGSSKSAPAVAMVWAVPRQHGASPAVQQGEDIPFEWAIICCAMHHARHGTYYDSLLDLLPGMAHKNLVATASLEAVHAVAVARLPRCAGHRFRSGWRGGGYPASHHDAAYDEAHRHFCARRFTPARRPESIYAAIVRCHAERIGHGTFVFDDSQNGRDIKDKAPMPTNWPSTSPPCVLPSRSAPPATCRRSRNWRAISAIIRPGA